MQIMEMLSSVEVLLNKDCNTLAKKELLRAKKMAVKFERTILLYACLRLEERIAVRLKEEQFIPEVEERIHEWSTTYSVMEQELAIMILHRKMIANALANFEMTQGIVEIMKNPLLQDESEIKSFGGKDQFFTIHSIYTRLLNDAQGELDILKRVLRMWEEYPQMIKRYPRNYLIHKLKFLFAFANSEGFNPSSFAPMKKEFEEDEALSISLREAMAQLIDYTELFYYIDRRLWAKAGALCNNIASYWPNHSEIIEWLKVDFTWGIAQVFFCHENYQGTSRALDAIVNSKKTRVFSAVQLKCRQLYLLAHFELENYSLLETYLIKSITRDLKKADKFTPYWQLFLKYLKKLCVPNDARTKILIWKDFEAAIMQDGKRSSQIDSIFSNWVISHRRGISLLEVFEENSKSSG